MAHITFYLSCSQIQNDTVDVSVCLTDCVFSTYMKNASAYLHAYILRLLSKAAGDAVYC